MSLFKEVYTYFMENCVKVRLTGYRFFKMDTTGEFFVMLILGIFFGIFLASLAIIYQKRYLGRFITRLQQKSAFSEENAQTLADLGLARSLLIRHNLQSQGSVMRKLVVPVTQNEPQDATDGEAPTEKCETEQGETQQAEKKAKKPKISLRETIDFETTRFYIPENLRYRAEFRFRRRGSTPLLILFSLLTCASLAVIFILFYPDLIRLADNTLGLFM